jgi:hypothetical protein
MKKMIIGLAFCTLTLFFPFATSAQLSQFAGNWQNIDPKTRGITRLEISENEKDVTVHGFGRCSPIECDMGKAKATAYAPSVDSNLLETAQALTVIYKSGFAEKIMMIRPIEGDRLRAEIFTHFTDNSRRSDFTEVYTFTNNKSK